MAAECAQVVTLADKQKASGKSIPPPKNICQPFTLRLVLGVPIIKEENKIFSDLEGLFSKYARIETLSTNQLSDKIDVDLFWNHMQTGVNSIVKLLEDAVRETSTSKTLDPFAVVLLDFAWLNSQLGHHLAHICSGTPHTSLLAVSPPGKLGKMLNSSSKVICVGIRPLMTPQCARLPQLRDFLRACAALTGKPLPPDPAASTTASLAAAAVAAAGGSGEGGGVAGATVGSTPQYVPILPKPPTTVFIPSHASVDITPASAGYVVAAGGGGGTPGLISNSLIGHPGPSHAPIQKAQLPPKPPVPRPAVRHIPADDWLTYKLDHGKLYKCGADISKELENHSLYIHDVTDIWALYPRQLQKPDLGMRRSAPPPSKSHKSRPLAPPSKQRRTAGGGHQHHAPPPPPPDDYFDEDEEEEEDEEGLADVDDDDEAYGYHPGPSAYLESPPSRHHRYSRHHQQPAPSPNVPRGMYHRKQQQQHLESSGQYSGLGKRRARGDGAGGSSVGARRSPRW
ncbi:hypothetical protein TSMEX_004537 [Taenia solium]|eukprot:TsM_001214300 transcript=TsM_001214300 gene=TsM_001214300